jgi:hypothetical protein
MMRSGMEAREVIQRFFQPILGKESQAQVISPRSQ